ncbi:MAG TPA: response regulator [Planctomycetota bacterium]|nr:response regulator [Planctomycetota bacterium]
MFSVLHIDDNTAESDLLALAAAEASLPIAIGSAPIAREAYTRLTLSSAERWPHLVLLDLNMPRLDGRGFLSLRRADRRLARLPVFVYTSSTREADVSDCFDLGADGYLVKPPDWDSIVVVLEDVARFLATGAPVGAPLDATDAPAPSFVERQAQAWDSWVRARSAMDESWRRIARSLDALSQSGSLACENDAARRGNAGS